MKLQRIIRPLGCTGGCCPGIICTDNGSILVQGAKLRKPEGVEVPDHEDLVQIPQDVFEELIQQYLS